MTIAERLQAVKDTLPDNVELVAVSKYHPVEELMEAYDSGQRLMGENIVQELRTKQPLMPQDVKWHFIGHLQTNKVKYIAPYVTLIHSVDSYHLLEEINRQAQRCGRVIDCLLQLHVAQEETKYGFSPRECLDMLRSQPWSTLSGVRLCGVMCMASNVDDTEHVRSDFRNANDVFNEIKEDFFNNSPHFCIRSWGMSHDYRIAIDEGSNMVRVGTAIFGERNYGL
ncbi:MAG: YggS family pyridoxal phosphate-dependent enzyme [Bacteroidaceae bacterium]|nr:YggS family pyridoxal phosphate-dependent enzyme [Bacteroidaceae bacterium]MBO4593888.1 YggS family pyridoxal phosphate-dependent enzyme [Bacteroidaceae bacterium]MBR4782332.1 YggS family pyridoxal phosphate-dependent enzyme [Bacteroidaceae bacterium]